MKLSTWKHVLFSFLPLRKSIKLITLFDMLVNFIRHFILLTVLRLVFCNNKIFHLKIFFKSDSACWFSNLYFYKLFHYQIQWLQLKTTMKWSHLSFLINNISLSMKHHNWTKYAHLLHAANQKNRASHLSIQYIGCEKTNIDIK